MKQHQLRDGQLYLLVGPWKDWKLHVLCRDRKRFEETLNSLAPAVCSFASGNCTFHVWQGLQNQFVTKVSNHYPFLTGYFWGAYSKWQNCQFENFEHILRIKNQGADTSVEGQISYTNEEQRKLVRKLFPGISSLWTSFGDFRSPSTKCSVRWSRRKLKYTSRSPGSP